MRASCGHVRAHLEQLVDLLLVLDDRRRRPRRWRSGRRTRRRPRPGRAAPGSRRATAPRASTRTAAAGSRRSRRGAGRAAGPASARPPASASHQRGERAPGERLPDAELLLAQRRRVGRAAACSSRRRGKVVCTGCDGARRGAARRPKRVRRDFRKNLTPCCRSDDKLRDNTLGCIPLGRGALGSALDVDRAGEARDRASRCRPPPRRTTSIR